MRDLDSLNFYSLGFHPPGFDELYILAAIREQGRAFNKASAEKSVAQMIRMLTQKSCEGIGLPFQGNLERVVWELVYHAVSLYMKRQVTANNGQLKILF